MTPVRTTCPYCGVGCGVLVSREDSPVDQVGEIQRFSVRGDSEHPANLGRLCSKGAALGETLSLDDRLLHPEMLGERVTWDAALDSVAQRFRQVIAEHGPDAVAFYVSGQLLTEDYYVANKLMKGFIGSGNIDTNSRLCMSSAVVGHKRAFGSDTVPGCYEDLEIADLIVLTGSNTAWAHPVAYQRIVAAKKARPGMKIVLIDPRRTATTEIADLHLAIKPGMDAWLFNGLLNHLRREDGIDWSYLEQHVEGFGAALEEVGGLSIPKVAAHCGLAEADVAEFYRLFTQTPKTVTVFSQGINQSSSGVDKVNSILNVHLATGRVGLPGASPFSITGQPNAMGGREVGGLANQLAAHMDIVPECIERVGRFWNAPNITHRPGLKAVELFDAVREGRIKAIWIMATNPAVSLPEADRAVAALKQCEFVVVSDNTRRTDTARLAHVLLPAAAWGEKDGTVTNSERRISRQRAFLPLPGEARPDWWIVNEVARRMGHAEAFAFDGPAVIFAEHAALSGFENDGTRDFDISALLAPPFARASGEQGVAAGACTFPLSQRGSEGDLSTVHTGASVAKSPPAPLWKRGEPVSFTQAIYDALEPVQWPIRADGCGTPRLFGQGRYFTASHKARLIARAPRGPATPVNASQPFIFNTGRIRDQWHTMSRSGKAARLLSHIAEPYIEMHPADIQRAAVTPGAIARIRNGRGEMLARVVESADQRLGSVFAPIHWNGQNSAKARVDALVYAVTDAISGQPEFKHAPVAVEPYAAGWHGFVLARERIDCQAAEYWTHARGRACWRHELAGAERDCRWPRQLREHFGPEGDWIDLRDCAANRYRMALLRAGRIEVVAFFDRDFAALPPRHWLEGLFEKESLNDAERSALLMGLPSKDVPDAGRIVCACFGVGENALKQAIRQGANSVEALGIQLQAGSNCGSCIPELKKLLAPS